ncbi:MAG: polysaccharide biosynthesis/export family protein [Muribaculaceae bacterium]|nr:polysaccharide biosynthesis/export family protein [Muribaculaceae bacterium]
MKKINLCILAIVAIFFASCSSQRGSLAYMEDLKLAADGKIVNAENYQVKIMPDDELLITVTSLVPSAAADYNLPLVNPAVRGEDIVLSQQPSQQTYIVNSEGNISMPILGQVHVAGLTTQQLTQQLEKRISQDVEEPIVRVQLLSFRINVLGEVKTPGAQKVDRERYTLLDALAAAGDLTEYGERENVLLIREENGKMEYHHFNLNSSKTLESPYFYLRQNDVIYVEPNKIRSDNSKYNQYNAYKISITSTIVSACSVIASLVIALTVK